MTTLSVEEALNLLGRTDLVKKAAELDEDYTFASRDATYISCVKALVKAASADQLTECKVHARFWGVTDDVEAARKTLGGVKRAEVDDGVYAMVQTSGDKVIRKYAAYDKQSTSDAAEAFYENRHRYPLQWKRAAAEELLARGQRHSTNFPAYVDEYLHKVAGLGFVSPAAAQDAYAERLVEVGREHEEATAKLGQVLCAFEDDERLCTDYEFVKQAMDVLEAFDVQTGFVAKYAELSMPEDIIDGQYTACNLEKVAAYVPQEITLVNGRSVMSDGLTKEALAAVDPGLADMSEAQLADVLPTLPAGDADLLVRLT